METIRVLGRFHAGHRQREHPSECRWLHGHTWRGEFVVRAERFPRDDLDMAIDFAALKEIMKDFDHKFIVTADDLPLLEGESFERAGFVVIEGRSPSVENVAYHCLQRIKDVIRETWPSQGIEYYLGVTIQETDNNFFIVDETVTI